MTEVNVSWGSERYELKVDTTQPVRAFMELLQKKTGVPVDRMKLAMRRKQLKPADLWDSIGLKPKDRIMMLGTAELPPEPVDEPISDDDNQAEEDDEQSIPKKYWEGLPNVANNCYLNATLQSLRSLPKAESIIENAEIAPDSPESKVVMTISELFKKFPSQFNQAFDALKKANPELFAAVDDQGMPRQQDATESYFYILKVLSNLIPNIRKLFEIGFDVTQETGENGEKKTFTQYSNNIPIDMTEDARQIEQGIHLDMEDVRKDDAGNDVLFREHRTISSLPKYLNMHINRFQFKKDVNSTVKRLARIAHPFRVDMLPFLSPDLRKEILAEREAGNHDAGFYSLKVVLTHRGRSADYGHYITHCKYNDTWIRYDDKKVTEVDEDAIQQLSGSGDWHSSLLLIYEKVEE